MNCQDACSLHSKDSEEIYVYLNINPICIYLNREKTKTYVYIKRERKAA